MFFYMFFTLHMVKSTLCAFDISVNVHIYLLYKGGIRDPPFDLFAILFLCLPENCFFSQDSCGCIWEV